MGIITSLLLALTLLKIVAIINAVHWVRKHGNAYGQAFATNQPESDAARFSLLEAHNGRFFPFGAKGSQLPEILRSRMRNYIGEAPEADSRYSSELFTIAVGWC